VSLELIDTSVSDEGVIIAQKLVEAGMAQWDSNAEANNNFRVRFDESVRSFPRKMIECPKPKLFTDPEEEDEDMLMSVGPTSAAASDDSNIVKVFLRFHVYELLGYEGKKESLALMY